MGFTSSCSCSGSSFIYKATEIKVGNIMVKGHEIWKGRMRHNYLKFKSVDERSEDSLEKKLTAG